MKTLFLFIGLSCLYILCGCNTSIEDTVSLGRKDAQDSLDYIAKAVAFVKEVEGKPLNSSNFYLMLKPELLEKGGCWDDIKSQDNGLTQDEVEFISTGKYFKIDRWQKEWFPNLTIVDRDSLIQPGYDNTEAFLAFQKKYKGGFNSFSFPVFLRNYAYCLYYSESHCGTSCGHGVLNLYKRVNGKWEVVKKICYWIS